MFYKRGEVKISNKSQEIYDKLIDHGSDLYMIKMNLISLLFTKKSNIGIV